MLFKRAFDIFASGVALAAFSPLMLLAAIGIKLRSPGPVIYQARRAGLNGRLYTMHKFRTMHVRIELGGSVITAPNDQRIFPFGAMLRKLKIDELPQLWDVLRGEMSIVGPRPEDPAIVRDHYTDAMRDTLKVRPGLASPGSLFGSTHGDDYLDDADPEGSYIRNLLPVKLAVEEVYVERASLAYDASIIFRTIMLLVQTLAGRKKFPEPPELAEARKRLDLADSLAYPNSIALRGA